MSVASHDKEAADQVSTCPGCAERDAEIQKLQEELTAIRRLYADTRRFNSLCLLIVGLGVFLLAPFAVFLLTWPLEMLSSDFGWIAVCVQSVLWCVPLSFCCLVGLIVALHWRPRWQRLAVGFGLLALFVIAGISPFITLGEDDYLDLIAFVIALMPMTVALSVLPTFILRSLHRWTITPRLKAIQPRPVTLSSYFVLVSLFGLATACLRMGDPSKYGVASTAEAIGGFLMYFGVPAISMGGLFAVLLPAILQSSGERFSTWVQRLIGIVLATAAGPILLGLAILVIGDESLNWEVVASLLCYCLAVTAGAFVVATVSIIWLRLLDYRLLSLPRRDRSHLSLLP